MGKCPMDCSCVSIQRSFQTLEDCKNGCLDNDECTGISFGIPNTNCKFCSQECGTSPLLASQNLWCYRKVEEAATENTPTPFLSDNPTTFPTTLPTKNPTTLP